MTIGNFKMMPTVFVDSVPELAVLRRSANAVQPDRDDSARAGHWSAVRECTRRICALLENQGSLALGGCRC